MVTPVTAVHHTSYCLTLHMYTNDTNDVFTLGAYT